MATEPDRGRDWGWSEHNGDDGIFDDAATPTTGPPNPSESSNHLESLELDLANEDDSSASSLEVTSQNFVQESLQKQRDFCEKMMKDLKDSHDKEVKFLNERVSELEKLVMQLVKNSSDESAKMQEAEKALKAENEKLREDLKATALKHETEVKLLNDKISVLDNTVRTQTETLSSGTLEQAPHSRDRGGSEARTPEISLSELTKRIDILFPSSDFPQLIHSVSSGGDSVIHFAVIGRIGLLIIFLLFQLTPVLLCRPSDCTLHT